MTPTIDLQAMEEARLEALRQSGLLDTPPVPVFDLITKVAAKALNVPVVLMSLVDADRQFFTSQCGLPAPWAEERETPLSHSFCQYVAAVGEALVVDDARTHPLVRDNPAVHELGVIAYAGMPLTTEDGFTLGSLCAIDTEPRHWSAAELEILHGFARQAMAEFELRKRVERLDQDLDALRVSSDEQRTQTRHLVHDLRTPLNALHLGIDGLSILGPLSEPQRDCLALIQRNAGVLGELVHRLIAVGAGEAKAARLPCLPQQLVERALEQVAMLAEKAGVTLEPLSQPFGPRAVLGRPEDLTRALVNLIANGVKFTPRGGRVSVSLNEEINQGERCVRFTIRDTGIGIAAGDQRRIFREGVRLDHRADLRESTGIGLAFCRRAIEAEGGELTVESEPGQGSTFSFSLPVNEGRTPASAAVA
ncbi:MAG: GAF domain-containing sensor histidine kinase [Chthoniobacterales bacterium]